MSKDLSSSYSIRWPFLLRASHLFAYGLELRAQCITMSDHSPFVSLSLSPFPPPLLPPLPSSRQFSLVLMLCGLSPSTAASTFLLPTSLRENKTCRLIFDAETTSQSTRITSSTPRRLRRLQKTRDRRWVWLHLFTSSTSNSPQVSGHRRANASDS